MKQLLFFGLFTSALATTVAAAPLAIFLVRHAERADMNAAAQADPGLSKKGQARAEALAKELRAAGIRAIYASEFKRTQQTAAPLADSLGIKIEVFRAGDVPGLITKIKRGAGNVLVVGHSNTVPEIIKALGVTAAVTLSDKDYDDLFILVLEQRPQLIHLHYR